MAENKGKSGAGKFFLGALLGAAAGAIAGKFISFKKDGGEELDECGCEDKCECRKEATEKPVGGNPTEKKTTKKSSEKKVAEN